MFPSFTVVSPIYIPVLHVLIGVKVHIIPAFPPNITDLKETLDKMEEVGIYLIYDMRG
jgi:hypothetical protein